VVNIGTITNFEALASGTTIPITNYTPAQLLLAFPDGFTNLSWSVCSAFQGTPPWAGFQSTTLWYTIPRTNPGTQSSPPDRYSQSTQSGIRQNILGLDSGAATISASLGASNANNTLVLVREPVWDGVSQFRNELTWWISGRGASLYSGFGLPENAENTTPANFTSAQISDLYRARPTGYADPETGLSSGSGYYLGYFTLNPDGTMSFTRASASAPPPPATTLSIARAGNNSTISFATANGATYTLYFTNAGGLTSPLSTWPTSSTTVTGDGTTRSFLDTTTDPARVYRVGAH
jgi:hypothetical protein